eukprot:comp21916_c0_seq1/m.31476 comp21916_c0_seq1/g.31476  ORF comp21916_c0_seq1/g.31476 comp21916_c0_seq1/m.31476 type:complete len:526 (-) comp21916_c0_seq1:262-1839(-)
MLDVWLAGDGADDLRHALSLLGDSGSLRFLLCRDFDTIPVCFEALRAPEQCSKEPNFTDVQRETYYPPYAAPMGNGVLAMSTRQSATSLSAMAKAAQCTHAQNISTSELEASIIYNTCSTQTNANIVCTIPRRMSSLETRPPYEIMTHAQADRPRRARSVSAARRAPLLKTPSAILVCFLLTSGAEGQRSLDRADAWCSLFRFRYPNVPIMVTGVEIPEEKNSEEEMNEEEGEETSLDGIILSAPHKPPYMQTNGNNHESKRERTLNDLLTKALEVADAYTQLADINKDGISLSQTDTQTGADTDTMTHASMDRGSSVHSDGHSVASCGDVYEWTCPDPAPQVDELVMANEHFARCRLWERYDVVDVFLRVGVLAQRCIPTGPTSLAHQPSPIVVGNGLVAATNQGMMVGFMFHPLHIPGTGHGTNHGYERANVLKRNATTNSLNMLGARKMENRGMYLGPGAENFGQPMTAPNSPTLGRERKRASVSQQSTMSTLKRTLSMISLHRKSREYVRPDDMMPVRCVV